MEELISFDYAIKYLLKSKGDYDIIEAFISAILAERGYSPVKIKALIESESIREERELKRSIADLIVEDENGVKYIVEIDKSYTNLFIHKACFNTCRLIVDSISGNEDYNTIKKVFHIDLLYFPFAGMKAPLYHGKTIITEVERDKPLSLHIGDMSGNIFDVYNVFPEYFIISIPLFNDEISKEIDEWLYVMKHSKISKDFKSTIMQKVSDRLAILKMTDVERKKYNTHINKTLKERDYLTSAEEKGKKLGVQEGIEIGEKKGREEGKQEERLEIARKMLGKGKSIEEIKEITGLTEEEIERIKD